MLNIVFMLVFTYPERVQFISMPGNTNGGNIRAFGSDEVSVKTELKV